MSRFSSVDFLTELGISFVESAGFSLNVESTKTLTNIFQDYVSGKQNFSTTATSVQSVIGRLDPLIRLKEIIELPEMPLPYRTIDDQGPRKKTRTWTAIEDQRLLAGVARFGVDNWHGVAQFLGSGRNRAQCSQRWSRCLNPKISKKPWSKEEDQKLLQLVEIHGNKAWMKISLLFENRSDVQLRYRWKQLNNCEEKDNSNPEDEDEQPMSLGNSRKFISTPNFMPIKKNQFPSITNFYARGDEEVGSLVLGGQSLNSFLNSFHPKVCE